MKLGYIGHAGTIAAALAGVAALPPPSPNGSVLGAVIDELAAHGIEADQSDSDGGVVLNITGFDKPKHNSVVKSNTDQKHLAAAKAKRERKNQRRLVLAAKEHTK